MSQCLRSNVIKNMITNFYLTNESKITKHLNKIHTYTNINKTQSNIVLQHFALKTNCLIFIVCKPRFDILFEASMIKKHNKTQYKL